MIKYIITILILTSNLFAQENTYKLLKDISYRKSTDDSYIKERCKLDLYLPENKKDFPTLIFFHVGGLKGGNKYIPKLPGR